MIPEAQESDSGVYICSANGVVGKVTLNIGTTDSSGIYTHLFYMSISHSLTTSSYKILHSTGQDNPFFPWVYVAVAVAAVILIMVLAAILVRIWLKRYRSRKLPAGLTRRCKSHTAAEWIQRAPCLLSI